MTIHFYKHCDMPDDMNEKRAFFRVARLLDQLYGRSQTDRFLLIANVDPQKDGALPRLPQLDAVLLGSRLVAFLEFKSYYDPVIGPSATDTWYTTKRGKKDQVIHGGAAKNPYQQAQYAKGQWGEYLQSQTHLPVNWRFTQHFVLFYPFLNNQSRIHVRGIDHYWLHFDGVDEIGRLIAESGLKEIVLSLSQMEDLAHGVWRASRWYDVDRLLHRAVGHLCVQIPSQDVIRMPLNSYSEVMVGRRPSSGSHIELPYSLISGQHARLEVLGEAVRLFDVGSKNGTLLNGQSLDNERGALLVPGDVAYLGGKGIKAVQLWFEPSSTLSPPDDYTRTATG